MTGTVVSLKIEKGYGFIRPDDGSKDLFFHRSALSEGLSLDEALLLRRVRYATVSDGPKGLRAECVRPAA